MNDPKASGDDPTKDSRTMSQPKHPRESFGDTLNAELSTHGHAESPRPSGIAVRCPYCQHSIKLDPEAQTRLGDIRCPGCGSHFSLVEYGIDTTRRKPAAKQFAHFELIEELGVGAYGSVWKARDTELDRTVAVKIPRKEQLDSTEMEQFFREARAAAQLNHPNIVTVHEVGREGDTVYIVSDLVRGVPLDEWLVNQQLTSRDAAQLCAKLAEAIQHAHEAGVIHRDLKPGNVLLDGDGEPHVMDFGLAKREAGEVTMTVEGHVLGTPAYMSPEQARGDGHLADRRTDVYSLGVILFKLLTGELPFRGTVRMLLHQVLHQEPRSPRSLNDRVPRDLETITLKCLQKTPSRRYDSAKDLADDLQRFLDRKPIHARPVGPLERGFRWCRRHPELAASVAALAIVVVVGFLGVTWQWRRAEQERLLAVVAQQDAERARSQAMAARQEAQTQAETAGEVSAFLTNMFEASSPFDLAGILFPSRPRPNATDELTAKQILDRGADEILNGLSGQPEVQAALLKTIGGVYAGMQLPAEARPLLEKSLEIRREHFPEDELAIAESLYQLGYLDFVEGNISSAEQLMEEALVIRQRRLDSQDHRITETMFGLGSVLSLEARDLDRAEGLLRDVLQRYEEDPGSDSLEYALAALALAGNLNWRDYGGAEQSQLILKIAPTLAMNDETAPLGNALMQGMAAAVQSRLGFNRAAASLSQSAFATASDQLGPAHWATIYAATYAGQLAYHAGDGDRAMSIFTDTRAAARQAGFTKSYQYYRMMFWMVYVLGGHAESLARAGDTAKAEATLAPAIEALDEAIQLGRGSQTRTGELSSRVTHVGRALESLGRREEAIDTHQSYLHMVRSEFGSSSEIVATALMELGALQDRNREHQEAIQTYQQAADIFGEQVDGQAEYQQAMSAIENSRRAMNARTEPQELARPVD